MPSAATPVARSSFAPPPAIRQTSFPVASNRAMNASVPPALFAGVPVPAGDHRVELDYQPPYAWLLAN